MRRVFSILVLGGTVMAGTACRTKQLKTPVGDQQAPAIRPAVQAPKSSAGLFIVRQGLTFQQQAALTLAIKENSNGLNLSDRGVLGSLGSQLRRLLNWDDAAGRRFSFDPVKDLEPGQEGRLVLTVEELASFRKTGMFDVVVLTTVGQRIEVDIKRRVAERVESIEFDDGTGTGIHWVEGADTLPIGPGQNATVVMRTDQIDALRLDKSPYLEYTITATRDGLSELQIADDSLRFVQDKFAGKQPVLFRQFPEGDEREFNVAKSLLSKSDVYFKDLFANKTALGIGKGSYGEVIKVTEGGRDLAIKRMVVHPEDPEGHTREVQNLLSGTCSTCLQYYGARQIDGDIYIVSEFANGGDAWGRLSNREFFDDDDVLGLYDQIDELAWNRGFIHYDIKLENIFFRNGEAVLADFGVGSRQINRLKTSGTLYSMPPEVAVPRNSVPVELRDRPMVYQMMITHFLSRLVATGGDTKGFQADMTAEIQKYHRVLNDGDQTPDNYTKRLVAWYGRGFLSPEEIKFFQQGTHPDMAQRTSAVQAQAQWSLLMEAR